MKRNLWRSIAIFTICCSFILGTGQFFAANAKPAFARREGKMCDYCHLNPGGGGARGFRGLYYAKHKFSFAGFDEKKEAAKAGVKPGSVGKATKPTKKPWSHGEARPFG